MTESVPTPAKHAKTGQLPKVVQLRATSAMLANTIQNKVNAYNVQPANTKTAKEKKHAYNATSIPTPTHQVNHRKPIVLVVPKINQLVLRKETPKLLPASVKKLPTIKPKTSRAHHAQPVPTVPRAMASHCPKFLLALGIGDPLPPTQSCHPAARDTVDSTRTLWHKKDAAR